MEDQELEYLKGLHRPLTHDKREKLAAFDKKFFGMGLGFALLMLAVIINTEFNLYIELGTIAVIFIATLILSLRDKFRIMQYAEIHVITAHIGYTSNGMLKVFYYDFMQQEFMARNIPLDTNSEIVYSKGDTIELLFGQKEKGLTFIGLNPHI